MLAEAGIWLSWPIGWTAATVISLLFYRFLPLETGIPVQAAALELQKKMEAEDAAEGEYSEL